MKSTIIVLVLLYFRGAYAPGETDDETHRLSYGMKQQILREHNRIRSAVKNPTASKMMQMVWDDRLAEDAQSLSSTCIDSPTYGEDINNISSKIYYSSMNKHLATYEEPVTSTIAKAIEFWFNQKSKYNRETSKCSDYKCLAYIYLVKDRIKKVGCSITSCRNFNYSDHQGSGEYMICFYHPFQEINLDNITAPYVSGTPCSRCLGILGCVDYPDGKLCRDPTVFTSEKIIADDSVSSSSKDENGFCVLVMSFVLQYYARKYFL